MLLFRKFDIPTEAQLYLNLMNEHDIECFITNQYTNQLIPALSQEICLFVHKSEYIKAHRIMNEFDGIETNENHYRALADNMPSKTPMKSISLQRIALVIIIVLSAFILFRYLQY